MFVYLLIAISQIMLRRRTSAEKLTVKMWAFPVLSIIVVVAILGVLVQMGVQADVRIQLILSLGAWALVVILYFATQRLRGRAPVEAVDRPAAGGPAQRVLVMANETVTGTELLDELRSIDRAGAAEYLVMRAGQPDRHRAGEHKGAVFIWQATTEAAKARLDTHARRSCARRTSAPTERSATTGRCARWPMRWRTSSRTGW